MKNSIDTQYQFLLQDILENGKPKKDRTGTGTISVFGRTIRHNMSEGFPLLTTKKMAIKSIMTELKWFLKGDTNIKYLVDNGCNIWNGDAYKNYCRKLYDRNTAKKWAKSYSINKDGVDVLEFYTQEEFVEKIKTDDEFAKEWGELGPIYGKQWRDWGSKRVSKRFYDKKYPYSRFVLEGGIDQIKNALELLKTNPDSRRIMVNAWNVGDMDDMVLPPCHYGFQLYTRELSFDERIKYCNKNNDILLMGVPEEEYQLNKLFNVPKREVSLLWNQRSVDTPLGLPFNIASYGMLLLLFAHEVNMVPGELIGNLGDTHIYQNQIEGCKEQIKRISHKLPQVAVSNVDILNGEFDYEIKNYVHEPLIKFPLSN